MQEQIMAKKEQALARKEVVLVKKGEQEIYGREKVLERLLVRIAEGESLCSANRQALLNYYKRIQLASVSTKQKSLAEAYDFLKKVVKDINELIKADIEVWWEGVVKDFSDGKIKPHTVNKRFFQVGKFLRIHHGLKKGRYPECWDWLELPQNICKPNYIEPSSIPTQEQVKQMVEAAQNKGSVFDVRNQALIALLNDLGLRIGDAISIRIKDIQEEENYLVVTVPHSKSLPRTLVSYLAKPFIKKLLNMHPQKNVPDAPLFIDKTGKRLMYAAAAKQVAKVFEKVGYSPPQYKLTHIFRHAWKVRADRYFSQAQAEYAGGWSSKSIGNRIYSHFYYKELVEPYFRMIKGENNPMLAKECSCGWANSNIDFCEKCGKNNSKNP